MEITLYKNIHTAIEHSKEIVQQVRGTIKSKQNTFNEYICVFIVGSYGRYEAYPHSDIEWLVVYDDTLVGIQEVNIFQAQITESIAGIVGRERISIGKTFGEVVALSDLITNIGGIADTSRTLTYRILCLAEGTPLETNKCYEAIISKLSNVYGDSHTAGHRLLSFATDISRYWRTLRIDYKQKVDELKKPWALRGFKLRGARRYWYFSLILQFIAFGPRLEIFSDGREANAFEHNIIKEFMSNLSVNPSIRIKNAIQKIMQENHLINELFKLYDDYIKVINDFDAREGLDKLKFEERYENETYLFLRKACIGMHSTMSDIVISLPDFHRRQAIEMFLL